jgi:hypothetical protein
MLHIQRVVSRFVHLATESINKSEKTSKREIKNLKLQDLGQALDGHDLDPTPDEKTETKEEPDAVTLASELSSTSIEFIKEMGFVGLAAKLTERFSDVKDSWKQRESSKIAEWKELKAELEDIKKEIASEKEALENLFHTMQSAAALSEKSQAWQESGVEVTRDLCAGLQEIEEAKVKIGWVHSPQDYQVSTVPSAENEDEQTREVEIAQNYSPGSPNFEDKWGDPQSELRIEIFKNVLKIRQEWHIGPKQNQEERYVSSVKELCTKLRPIKDLSKKLAYPWQPFEEWKESLFYCCNKFILNNTYIVKFYEDAIDSFMSLQIQEQKKASFVLHIIGERLLDPTEFDHYTIDNILERQEESLLL